VIGRALRAEWTKARSMRSTIWSVAGIVVLTLGISALICAVGHTDAARAGQGDDDVVANSLFGVYLGQIAAISFGALVITWEHATGAIRTTMTAVPLRGRVLAAKTVVVSTTVIVAGSAATISSFLVSQPLLHDAGFVPPAYPFVTLANGPALRAVIGTAVYLAALAVLALGIGAILRSTAGAISVTVGLVLGAYVTAQFLPERARELVLELTPIAGLAIQQTAPRADHLPIGPWGGLAVTLAWAGAAMTLALWLIRRRDV
jgi:hypothetical protein